jgi:hypothetical protein
MPSFFNRQAGASTLMTPRLDFPEPIQGINALVRHDRRNGVHGPRKPCDHVVASSFGDRCPGCSHDGKDRANEAPDRVIAIGYDDRHGDVSSYRDI